MRCSLMPSPCPYMHFSPLRLSRILTRLSFPHSKTIDDIVFEVDCQLITIKAGADIDIGPFWFSSNSASHI